MSDQLTDSESVCCAHKRVAHSTEPAGEGSVRDVWACDTCGARFVQAARLEAVLADRDDWYAAAGEAQVERDCARAERDAERARADAAEGTLDDIDSEVPSLFECYDGTDEVDEDRPVPLYDRVVALRERAEKAEAAKDTAYSERNKLVAALSKVFYASLEKDPDAEPESEWLWVVIVQLPTGQVSWHIHESELSLFEHLPRETGNVWDGHTTELKYERLGDLSETDAGQRDDRDLWSMMKRERDEARARVAELEAGGWQPIETAPKDGSNVLLALERGWNVARWNAGEPDEAGLWGLAWGGVAEDCQVLGWMPLPPPPAGGESEEVSDA